MAAVVSKTCCPDAEAPDMTKERRDRFANDAAVRVAVGGRST